FDDRGQPGRGAGRRPPRTVGGAAGVVPVPDDIAAIPGSAGELAGEPVLPPRTGGGVRGAERRLSAKAGTCLRFARGERKTPSRPPGATHYEGSRDEPILSICLE